MEKLIYFLGQPDGTEVTELTDTLRGDVIDALKTAGASRLRACIRDEHVAAAEDLRMGHLAGEIWCYLSLWVPSRSLHPTLKSLLAGISSFQHGYAVAESEQLFHDFEPDGQRITGMNEVVMFRKPAGLDRQEFLKIWLDSHTRVAIDTQSTFGYIQHIVGDKLDEDGPWYDSIVEENFPETAMSSEEAFYGAEGDPDKYQRHLQAMMDSVVRFLDFDSMERLPMSEYNF